MVKKTKVIIVMALICLAIVNAHSVEAATKKVKSISVKQVTKNSRGKSIVKKIKKNKITIKKGEKKKLQVKLTISGKNVSKKFTVKNKNKKILRLVKRRDSIIIYGKKAGSAKVIITAKASKNKKKTITIKVVNETKKQQNPKPGITQNTQTKPGKPQDDIEPSQIDDSACYNGLVDEFIDISVCLENPDYKTIQCKNLPEGLTFYVDEEEKEINIYGTPKSVGVTSALIEYKTKMNQKYSLIYTFVIGSEKEIVTYVSEIKCGDNGNIVCRYKIAGGSGEYRCEIADYEYGLVAYEDCLIGTVSKKGEYTLTINVFDKSDETIRSSFSVSFAI